MKPTRPRAPTQYVPLKLSGLSNVDAAVPSDGDVLSFDAATGLWGPAAAGTGGVTDHGALTGLADDDHPQYHNDARGDARYSPLGHTHVEADITDLGNYAEKDVADTITGAWTFEGSPRVYPGSAANSYLYIDGDAGYNRAILFRTGTSSRWLFRADTLSETGSDAGSDLKIDAYTDAGSWKATVAWFRRSDSRAYFYGQVGTAKGYYANNSTTDGGFAVGSLGDRVDGAPWYGMGRGSVNGHSASPMIQVAGYYGVRLRAVTSILDIDGPDEGAGVINVKTGTLKVGGTTVSLEGHTHSGYALSSHSHSLNDLTTVEVTAAPAGSYIRYNGSSWVDIQAVTLLSDIKTVDGTGSGLDADLLDGNHASAFSLDGHDHFELRTTEANQYFCLDYDSNNSNEKWHWKVNGGYATGTDRMTLDYLGNLWTYGAISLGLSPYAKLSSTSSLLTIEPDANAGTDWGIDLEYKGTGRVQISDGTNKAPAASLHTLTTSTTAPTTSAAPYGALWGIYE